LSTFESEYVLILAAIMLHAYATTAQGAALRAMYFDPKHPAVVERVNVAGAYASVLTKGARMEGDPVTFAILVERFSFGWQAVDALNCYCNLKAHRLDKNAEDALMRRMPKPKDDRPCNETVRRMMRGPLVPYVVVSGTWAMGEWYGGGGGDSLFEKRDGRWRLVEDGGGAMGVDYMRRYGVPQWDWCKFGIFDAKCR
jgi:hypothetical protein